MNCLEFHYGLITCIESGLYTVEKYWSCLGKAGFKVYKFALRRCPDQAPPPWITNPNKTESKLKDKTKSQSKKKLEKEVKLEVNEEFEENSKEIAQEEESKEAEQKEESKLEDQVQSTVKKETGDDNKENKPINDTSN